MSHFSGALQLTDLDDFITPSQECIKPVEINKTKTKTGSKISIKGDGLYYESEEVIIYCFNYPIRLLLHFFLFQAGSAKLQKVEITLADCLACSGCITSAEGVLITQQSQEEFLRVLNENKDFKTNSELDKVKTIVATISQQAILSIATAHELDFDKCVSHMAGYLKNLGVDFILDTKISDDLALLESRNEFLEKFKSIQFDTENKMIKLPMLASSCPGFVCYAEKTHGNFILPYISTTRSPQQIMGVLVKQYLAQLLSISRENIYHVTIMPCYDKKLEASREEFFDDVTQSRDVDCVITPSIFLIISSNQIKF